LSLSLSPSLSWSLFLSPQQSLFLRLHFIALHAVHWTALYSPLNRKKLMKEAFKRRL
jgi:hypothetical protein